MKIKEYILCAAVQIKDKNIIVCGYRHENCFSILRAFDEKFNDSIKVMQYTQGFLTSRGRFVSRVEASKIAFKAGQISSLRTDMEEPLFSEDLY